MTEQTHLGKSVEDAANGGGVKEGDGGQAEAGHRGVVDTAAGPPARQQVDD